MNPLAAFGLRLKAAFNSLAGRFPGGQGYGRWGGTWPWGGRYEYAEVGDGGGNSAVMACVQWVATTFPEAPLEVLDPKGEPVPDHPLTRLVADPNPYYDGLLLLQQTLADFTISGNAYWLIGRNRAGRPVELWFAPSWMMKPRWPDDGSAFLSRYEYTPNATILEVPPEDVVHFRFGLDVNTRLGVSRLAPALSEVLTDEQAAAFTTALLKNMGVPGVILAPKSPDAYVSPEAADTLKEDFTRRFGGDRRGSVMVMQDPTDVSVLSFSPQQMNLRELRRIPEERISAVLGIPAIVAGLGAGLDRSTYANYAEARESAYESNIIPTQRIIAAAIRRQLLRHFADESRFSVAFDNSQVRVLQEDENAKSDRILKMVAGTLITVAEGRQALGWEVKPEHEVYLVSSTLAPTPPDLLVPPEPEPMPEEPLALPPAALEPPEEEAAKALAGTVPWAVATPEDLERLYERRRRAAGVGRS